MAGEIMSLSNDGALLEDDYAGSRRPRKGKAKAKGKAKKRRRPSDKTKSRGAKQSSRIYRAMNSDGSTPTPSTGA